MMRRVPDVHVVERVLAGLDVDALPRLARSDSGSERRVAIPARSAPGHARRVGGRAPGRDDEAQAAVCGHLVPALRVFSGLSVPAQRSANSAERIGLRCRSAAQRTRHTAAAAKRSGSGARKRKMLSRHASSTQLSVAPPRAGAAPLRCMAVRYPRRRKQRVRASSSDLHTATARARRNLRVIRREEGRSL